MSEEITTTQTTITPQNSSLAVISLISGVLGLTLLPLIGSIIAVITAPMAKREIDDSYGQLTGKEMASIGQILGWIGIALLGIGFCCCFALVIVPLLASLGIIFSTDTFYYWLGPGLLGLFLALR
jgi:uncharacterized protein YqhQ